VTVEMAGENHWGEAGLMDMKMVEAEAENHFCMTFFLDVKMRCWNRGCAQCSLDVEEYSEDRCRKSDFFDAKTCD